MQKYLTYISEFHENNRKGIEFVNNHLKGIEENQDEIEQILDYLYSNQKVDISKIGYSTILEKTKKWHKKLQSVAIKDIEIELVDYETFLDFGDGFKFVKLISKSCYEREGKLMSHCVASYYGRDSKIYSLRDSKNLPHCTIEDGSQIKGKGNGKIDPKYIDYVVKFLEKTGMTVGENEMKNLGYYKLDKIEKGLKSDSLYNGYIYEGKIDTITDENNNPYYGFGLLNIISLFTINVKLKFNIDIKKLAGYSATSGYYAHSATSGYSAHSATSGDYAHSATSGYSAHSATSGYSAHSATSGDYAHSSTSGDYAHSSTSGYSAHSATSGNSAHSATSGNSAHSATSGVESIACSIGYNSQAKSIIGNWLVLSDIEIKYGKYIVNEVKTVKVDGIIIKENTWYKLKKGEFIEVL